MRTTRLRRTLVSLSLAGVTVMSANALADPPQGDYGPGHGMGPGMMGGYGPQGGHGPGYMGPGMMGGCGPGHMGPGMMGGYGPGHHHMGPGDGYGPGYGMGQGMMGGYGHGHHMGPGYGRDPGMTGGYGPGYGALGQLNLAPEQWDKVNAIHDEFGRKQWELAGRMREEAVKLRRLMAAEKRERSAINAQYQKLQEVRHQRFEARLNAEEKLDAILTAEQRAQLRQFTPWQGRHMH